MGYREVPPDGGVMTMAEDDGGKGVASWLDLMLVQCSCAYFGWSYAKAESRENSLR
jgi:hypothetical protein